MCGSRQDVPSWGSGAGRRTPSQESHTVLSWVCSSQGSSNQVSAQETGMQLCMQSSLAGPRPVREVRDVPARISLAPQLS